MRRLGTDKDTICALATAPGAGAISVIRISGPQATAILRPLAPFLPSKLESHRVYYGILRGAALPDSVDEVLISHFVRGRSFTGEDTFEISCHGSEVLVDRILRELIHLGARPAERGEFTARAYLHGRLDLVQAESVLALVESRSPRAAQLALRQLQGDFSKILKGLMERVTRTLAHLEANIDFAAEDIEIAPASQLAGEIRDLRAEVEQLISGYRQGRIIRDGVQVALVGPPNAGKSSLLNALVGDERAIVTPIAGTTRDFVEGEVMWDGIRCRFIDTAGLRSSDDEVEKIGISRAIERIKTVDLVLMVVDSVHGLDANVQPFLAQIPWDRSALVWNKVDLAPARLELADDLRGVSVLAVSAVSGEGLDELRNWIRSRALGDLAEDSAIVSNARHYEGLERLSKCLDLAMPLMLNEDSPDLIALELQTGLQVIYELLGLTFDDQVMDRVFAEFCLGK